MKHDYDERGLIMEKYDSIKDVEEQYVVPALAEHADEYDTAAIASEISEWRGGKLVVTATQDEFNAILTKQDKEAGR